MSGSKTSYLDRRLDVKNFANQRILNITDTRVTFLAKDYRDVAAQKPVTLDGTEFLRRFTMHILPYQFVKIRKFGIYNPTLKRKQGLQFVPEEKPNIQQLVQQINGQETKMQRLERLTGVNHCLCLVCKTGRMVRMKMLPRIRSPGLFALLHSFQHS